MSWLKSIPVRAQFGTLYGLAYLILPNLPIWIFQPHIATLPHGYFNGEALVIGALSLFLWPTIGFLLLLVDVAAELIYLICITYQFSLRDFGKAAYSFVALPEPERMLAWFVLATVIAIAGITAYGIPRPNGKARTRTVAVLLGLCLLLAGIDILDGQYQMDASDRMRTVPRLSLNPVMALTKHALTLHRMEKVFRNRSNAELASASLNAMSLLGQAKGREAPNVVLVLVESWGLLRDRQLASVLTAGYETPEIRSKYAVSYGTVPFIGPTVTGEARELCHSQLGFGMLDISAEQSRNCLPVFFHSRGYRDIAVHGYMGAMFRRKEWYKTIGFDQAWFLADLTRAGLPICNGAFPGICDNSIAEWVGKTLYPASADQPEFVYWVTLNSHLPVPLEPSGSSCVVPGLSEAFCEWFRRVSRVHQSVEQLAIQAHGRPTLFVLVGDHAPPFANPNLRKMFSQEEVPYVILSPKGMAQQVTFADRDHLALSPAKPAQALHTDVKEDARN
jgi:phosphoglycerol transferase MdoB-like AlkP superfamily enzyme